MSVLDRTVNELLGTDDPSPARTTPLRALPPRDVIELLVRMGDAGELRDALAALVALHAAALAGATNANFLRIFVQRVQHVPDAAATFALALVRAGHWGVLSPTRDLLRYLERDGLGRVHRAIAEAAERAGDLTDALWQWDLALHHAPGDDAWAAVWRLSEATGDWIPLVTCLENHAAAATDVATAREYLERAIDLAATKLDSPDLVAHYRAMLAELAR